MTSRNLELLRPHMKKDKETLALIDTFIDKRICDDIYLIDSERLLIALDEYECIIKSFGFKSWAGTYRYLMSQINTDSTTKAEKNKVEERDQIYSQKLFFFEISLKEMSEQRWKDILSDDVLQKYHFFLSRLFESRQYTVSLEEEKIVDSFSKWAYQYRKNLTLDRLAEESCIIDGEDVTFWQAQSFLTSTDWEKRKQAQKLIEDSLSKNYEIAVVEMNAICEYKKQTDAIYSYQRPDSEACIRDLSTIDLMDLSTGVITDNFSITQDRYTLKTSLLREETLSYDERNRDLWQVSKIFSWEEAKDIVLSVYYSLDPEFGDVMKDVFAGRADVFPKQWKQWWAFAGMFSHTLPDFLFMNFTGKATDIKTLAHEGGHMLHDYYTRQQHSLYAQTWSIMAEVASTFFEDFVLQEIKSRLPEDEKSLFDATIIEWKIASTMRQVAWYNFEKELHEKYREVWYVSDINALFEKHMTAYMWSSIRFDEGWDRGWMYRWHFRKLFWTYYYALSECISQNLQKKYHQDSKNISLLKAFMSSWWSKDVVTTFADLWMDITVASFWQSWCDTLADMIANFKKTL